MRLSMSLHPYLVKLQLLNALVYRFEYFSSIGSNLFLLLGSVFLWRTAYRGINQVAGVNEQQMVTYAVMAVLMNAFFSVSINQTLFRKVREGEIALDLIRPVNLITYWLAEDAGRSAAAITKFALPVLLLSLLFVHAPVPSSLTSLLLFLPSCILSYLILWEISVLVGLSAFWVIEFGNVSAIKDMLVLVLSGRLIPLWLFPDVVQQVSRFLPFQYIFQAPLEIYIGRMPPLRALMTIMVQVFWVLLFGFLVHLGWGRAQRRIFVQGG